MKIENSIKIQWLVYFSIVIIFLTIFNIVFIIYRKQHYYNQARYSLNFSAATNNFKIESFENNNLNTTLLNNKIKNIVENFKNNDETIAVGFNLDEKATVSSNRHICKDYDELFKTIKKKNLNLKNRTFHCNLPNDEHIMLKIELIPSTNCEFSAIMYILSLRKFDKIIFKTEIFCLLVSILLMILIFITSQFFIKKFINPVKEIIKIAKNGKTMNHNFRIKINSSSEIEELYSAVAQLFKKIKNSEYAQNEFISSISHELRTPLTAIKGWSETISNSNYSKQILPKGINIISKEVERLSKMVEELLDFSKFKNGHIKLFKEKMDPFAELQEAVLIYSEIAKKQNKILTYKEQAIIPTIFGDKNRIKQVFINVIDNAIKYSNKGDVINVEAIVNEKTADVIIKDSGRGIAKNDLNKITEKFFKANNLIKGSGIGLAVVKEIIQKHSGNLKFESKPNKGTTVKISFPIFKNDNKQNINNI